MKSLTLVDLDTILKISRSVGEEPLLGFIGDSDVAIYTLLYPIWIPWGTVKSSLAI